jgi:hypothetical protein
MTCGPTWRRRSTRWANAAASAGATPTAPVGKTICAVILQAT